MGQGLELHDFISLFIEVFDFLLLLLCTVRHGWGVGQVLIANFFSTFLVNDSLFLLEVCKIFEGISTADDLFTLPILNGDE
ncbi:unnamed protein product [Schistosoma margrebowiei]|uniref:Uncharacterized protein n=1 Tax=Schistosoma margrebowiei TaxID=48269 RepID=A0A183N228_9TREM|nr:unnamed protein product [Schistosoma margrebowiei]